MDENKENRTKRLFDIITTLAVIMYLIFIFVKFVYL